MDTLTSFASTSCCSLLTLAGLVLLLLVVLRCSRRTRRRSSIQALTSIVVEKYPKTEDAPPSYCASSMQEHGRTSSLTRRNKSISRSQAAIEPQPIYPKTLQDISLLFKITLLQDYVKQQGDAFLFRADQSERLTRLDDEQLDSLWADIVLEVQRRESTSPRVHQALQLSPELSETRKECLSRLASIEQGAFLEMARDFLYELQRRQRAAELPNDNKREGILPPDILVRTDIDWKGHDPRQFGKLRIEETELIKIARTEAHVHRFQCFLFDRIFLALKPSITPSLKGRVFTHGMTRVEGWKDGDVYKLALHWTAQGTEDSMTMIFRDQAKWTLWADGVRDTVLRQRAAQGKP